MFHVFPKVLVLENVNHALIKNQLSDTVHSTNRFKKINIVAVHDGIWNIHEDTKRPNESCVFTAQLCNDQKAANLVPSSLFRKSS